MDIALNILAGVLLVLGSVGIVLPGLPDLPLAYGGLVLRSSLTNFTEPSVQVLVAFLIGLIVISLIELVVGPLAVKKSGGSRYGIAGAFIGGLIGILFVAVNPLSLLFGPLLGAFIGELIAGQTKEQALKSAAGTAFGFLGVLIIKVLFSLGLIAAFLLSFF